MSADGGPMNAHDAVKIATDALRVGEDPRAAVPVAILAGFVYVGATFARSLADATARVSVVATALAELQRQSLREGARMIADAIRRGRPE